MEKLDLEKMIAEEILANKGIIALDDNDVKKLRDGSDFMDGTVVDGKLDDLGELASKAISSLKGAHPQEVLTMLLMNIRVAKGSELIMCQLAPINELLCDLGDDIFFVWGIEVNAPVCDEVRLCVLGGFK